MREIFALNLGRVFRRQKFLKNRRGAFRPDVNEGSRFHLFWTFFERLPRTRRRAERWTYKIERPVLSWNVFLVKETSDK